MKNQRVEAIAMIMGLCLLVYTLAQRKLRQELESSGISVKNQVKKLTNKPTMRCRVNASKLIWQKREFVHDSITQQTFLKSLTLTPLEQIKPEL